METHLYQLIYPADITTEIASNKSLNHKSFGFGQVGIERSLPRFSFLFYQDCRAFFCQYHLLKLVSQSPHHKSSYSVYTEIKSLINHLTPASTESHLLVFEAVFQKF